MVRNTLIGLACLCSFSAGAITPEELKNALAEKQRQKLERQRRANTGAVGELVPGLPPKSNKYSTSKPQSDSGSARSVKKPAPTRRATAKNAVPAGQPEPDFAPPAPAIAPVPPATSVLAAPAPRAPARPVAHPLSAPTALPSVAPTPDPTGASIAPAPPSARALASPAPFTAAQPVALAGSEPAVPPSIAPPALPPDTSHLYTPPARSAPVPADQSIVSDSVRTSIAFGVRLGTWLNASLDRNTTSGESGEVELTLTADAIGDRRTVPAGTLLFASKALNNATKRMEMVVTHGITPTGLEFEMHGLVFDPRKTPGLAGVYVLDQKAAVKTGATRGALAAVGAAVSKIGGGAIGEASNVATQSVLKDASQTSELNNAHEAIIYVSPQALIIRVDKQF